MTKCQPISFYFFFHYDLKAPPPLPFVISELAQFCGLNQNFLEYKCVCCKACLPNTPRNRAIDFFSFIFGQAQRIEDNFIQFGAVR